MFTYLIRLKIKGRLQYGRALLYDILSGVIIYIFDVLPIAIILMNFKILNWSTFEILLLYSLSRAGRVFGDLIFWMPMFGMDALLKEGRLERYILAPINPFLHFIGNQFSTFTLGHCVGSIVVAITCIFVGNVQLNPVRIVSFLISFVGGSLAYAGIIIALGSIAFWTLDLTGISQMLMSINKFTNYPITIFPHFIRVIITFIIPLAITSYYPSAILLGKQKNALIIAFLIGMAGAMIFWAAYKLWCHGVKKYRGTGS